MSLTIDLNADLGELPGADGRASDAAILEVVTSCAIACGGHAGDDAIMEATLRAAFRHKVAAGAHPSYPDRKNFGRKSMDISLEDLAAALREQMKRLHIIAARTGVPLTHVKPHGALYNDAAKSADIAGVIATQVKFLFGTEIALVGPPNSATEKAARSTSLPFHAEGFIDRTYLPDGALMPRSQPGAVLHDTPARLAQALHITTQQSVRHSEGGLYPLNVQTLCLHGDSPGAAQTASALKAALDAEGVTLRAPELA